MPYKDKEKQREWSIQYHKKYNKESYWYMIEHGLCPKCGQKLAPNKHLCPECLEKANLRRIDYKMPEQVRLKANESARAKYQRRKDAGLCTKCGRKIIDGDHLLCHICREKKNRRAREKRAKELDMKYKYDDTCCRYCGKPVVPGKKLCPEHYEKACQTMAYARSRLIVNPWRDDMAKFFTKK